MPTNTATSDLYWLSAAVLTIVNLTAIFCLIQFIPATKFRLIGPEITVVSVLFWGGLWVALMANEYVWRWCYCFIFSHTERWLMPPIMAAFYGLVGYGMWWTSTRFRYSPILLFAVLAAFVSLPEHLWAIYGAKVLETPLMQHVSVAASIVFGIFEFVFYWILILTLAVFINALKEWWREGRQDLMKHLLQL